MKPCKKCGKKILQSWTLCNNCDKTCLSDIDIEYIREQREKKEREIEKSKFIARNEKIKECNSMYKTEVCLLVSYNTQLLNDIEIYKDIVYRQNVLIDSFLNGVDLSKETPMQKSV